MQGQRLDTSETKQSSSKERKPPKQSSKHHKELPPAHMQALPEPMCDLVALGHIKVLHVPTTSQYANVFTKGLPSTIFKEFRSSLNVDGNDDPTARLGVLA
jgi:hypothetical protein